VQFHKSELGRTVDGHQQVQLALPGPHFGEIDVKVADGVCLELRPCRLAAVDLGQPADAMALQTAVKRRARQMRDRCLESVQAIIQREQGVASKEGVRYFV
jgi:hypothetical protein